jgi:hypothetical protein
MRNYYAVRLGLLPAVGIMVQREKTQAYIEATGDRGAEYSQFLPRLNAPPIALIRVSSSVRRHAECTSGTEAGTL